MLWLLPDRNFMVEESINSVPVQYFSDCSCCVYFVCSTTGILGSPTPHLQCGCPHPTRRAWQMWTLSSRVFPIVDVPAGTWVLCGPWASTRKMRYIYAKQRKYHDLRTREFTLLLPPPLSAAVFGHVSWWALHWETSEDGNAEVQKTSGRDHQRHQEEERGEEAAVLQHVPRQDTQQCRYMRHKSDLIFTRHWSLFNVLKQNTFYFYFRVYKNIEVFSFCSINLSSYFSLILLFRCCWVFFCIFSILLLNLNCQKYLFTL